MKTLDLGEEKICFIEIDITIDGIVLKDRFEWDITEDSNNPVEFAQTMVNDLGLPRVFENKISFQICKQIFAFKKNFTCKD